MFLARLLAPGETDPDRRRSLVNTRAGTAVLVVLLAAIAARAGGLGWATWVGLAAGGVAFVVAVVQVPRSVTARSTSRSAAARALPNGERRRIARLVHSGRPVPGEDVEVADEVARGMLHNLGLQVWFGPLIVTGQLSSLPVHDGFDVVGLVLLVLGVSLMVGALVSSARCRRVLIARPDLDGA